MENSANYPARFLLLTITLLISLATSAQLHKLVFAPQWLPQAQFAGYYVAQEKGFYKNAGLEVEILHPSVNVQATAMLASGKADVISLFLITAMSNRCNGLELVNAGQISQHSAMMIVTKKSSGINSLEQLNGKKVGIWKSGFDEVPKALLAERKIAVNWIPVLSTVNLFMLGGIDAMTVMSYNEYDQIINCGINEDELTIFPAGKYGFDLPEDGLYCLKKNWDSKKDDLHKFLTATLQGWAFALSDKKYAIELVIKQMQLAHLPANKVHQEWMLDKVLELITPKGNVNANGILQESDFNKAVEILTKKNGIPPKYSFSDFYPPK